MAAGKTDVCINITANIKKWEEEKKELLVTILNAVPELSKNAAKKKRKRKQLEASASSS